MTVTRVHGGKVATLGTLSAFLFLASPAALLAGPAHAAGAPSPAPALLNRSVQLAAAKDAHSPHSAIEHVEARITELHKKLGITPDQDPQFKAYADVMRSNAETMDALFQERAQSTGTSAADAADNRFHWYARLTAAHAEAVGKLVPVFDALYQSLSDQQKKTADALFQHYLQQRRMPHRGHRAHHAG
jgi:periplasmic protein CpxP/Spy